MSTAPVVVLNTTYEPLHQTTVRLAFDMLWRGVAVAIEEGPEMFGPVPVPRVLKLVRFVKATWLYGRRNPGRPRYEAGSKVTWDPIPHREAVFTLENLLRRDGHRCAYCGGEATTFDHVVPRSKGGPSEWLNALSACEPCNSAKADLSLDELDWTPLWQPWTPTVQDLLYGRGA